MGEAKRRAEAELARRTAHATKIVAAFEKFIDENIATMLRAHGCGAACHIQHDINGLHDARNALIQILVVPPAQY